MAKYYFASMCFDPERAQGVEASPEGHTQPCDKKAWWELLSVCRDSAPKKHRGYAACRHDEILSVCG
jgi:hypothetical protein